MVHDGIYQQKLATYKRVLAESGPESAWKALFEGYPERQARNMGQYIVGCSLAEGFAKAIPSYRQLGMDMRVVDISNSGKDSVLEIQRICPVIDLAREYGLGAPCHIICEMDLAATEVAFPEISGGILSRIAGGDCVCMFKYERQSLPDTDSVEH